ncbi:MAG: hypothetical protein DVB28_000445 [Verrucomicrobia bacterium]|nr:MAG: hypothetical protein DVB28_000445 [Verrucomicrobiota bacterium]
MILTSPKYDSATARSLRIHNPARNFWGIDPTEGFQNKYRLRNGGRLGLIKKDIGTGEARRRGWGTDNTNYGHSLSLTERFITRPEFSDVLDHFTTLDVELSKTSPCAGNSFYGTKYGFTILESIAFFLFHGFEMHLDPSFLGELPNFVGKDLSLLQERLSKNAIGWTETLESLSGNAPKQLQTASR